MPQTYPASGPNSYKIPQYTEKADGVAAFQQFVDSLEQLITPIGTIVPWAAGDQSTPPAGWLLCDGNNYPRDRYKALAALLGTTWGTAPDGFFKVPNLKGRILVGRDPGDTDFATIAKMDGVKSVTLTTENLPSHEHNIGPHGHDATVSSGSTAETAEAGDHGHANSTVTIAEGGLHQHPTGYTSKKGAGSLPDGTILPLDDSQNKDLTGNGGSHKHTGTVTVTNAGGHKHTLNIPSLTVKVNNSAEYKSGGAGAGKSFKSLGPYAVVHYIIRADIVRS